MIQRKYQNYDGSIETGVRDNLASLAGRVGNLFLSSLGAIYVGTTSVVAQVIGLYNQTQRENTEQKGGRI